MFERWCRKRGIEEPLDARVSDIMRHVDDLMSERRPRSPRTMLLRLHAVACHMRTSGRPDPLADPSLRQLRTRLTVQSSVPKVWQPFRGEDIRKAFSRQPAGLIELRDRAMLLNMYVSRLTSQQVLGLRLSDVRFVSEDLELAVGGKRIFVYRGKTNLCPVAALMAWIDAIPVRSGPLFPRLRTTGQPLETPPHALTRQNIHYIVRKYARRIGINPAGICANSLLMAYDMDFNATRALAL
jgi:integrase